MNSRRWSVICAFALVAVGVGLLPLAVSHVQEMARDSTCRGKQSQMRFALHLYHEAHGHFPSAYVAGPDGTPWHSWRVEILPYMEHQHIYERYRFDEPWNGPNNRLLAGQVRFQIFQCPSNAQFNVGQHTNIVVIVGEETAFPGSKTTKLSDFREGGGNTILLAEYRNLDIHWMEPRDLHIGEMSLRFNDPTKPSISGPHSRGPAVVFGDSIHAYRLRQPLSESVLYELTRTNGDERVQRKSLVRPNTNYGTYLSEQE
jgi:hypothetical protein